MARRVVNSAVAVAVSDVVGLLGPVCLVASISFIGSDSQQRLQGNLLRVKASKQLTHIVFFAAVMKNVNKYYDNSSGVILQREYIKVRG